MKKAQQMRNEALQKRKVSVRNFNFGRTFTRQDSPDFLQRAENHRNLMLREYVEKLEQLKNKNYSDNSGVYKDNISKKYIKKMPPIVANLELNEEDDDQEDEEIINEFLSGKTLENVKSVKSKTKIPFDLYSVFEYSNKKQKTKEISIKPIDSTNFYKTQNFNTSKSHNINLLKTIDYEISKPKIAFQNSPQNKKRVKKLLSKTSNISYGEELNNFIDNYLDNSNKKIIFVFFYIMRKFLRNIINGLLHQKKDLNIQTM